MRSVQHLVESIEIPDRMRKGINEETVTQLTESIRSMGLQMPITVRWETGQDDDDHLFLVAGRHRLEACRRIGVQFIDCIEFDGDESAARMWEIAENLHRADLTALERAEHVAEWMKLAEDQQRVLRQSDAKPSNGRPEGGVRAAARGLGISEPNARRSKSIASMSDEAKDAARDAGLDRNQSALLTVAKAETPQQQVAVVKRLAEAKPVKPAPAPTNDIETEEAWLAAIMRVWNRGAPQWRERFLSTVDTPVFDRG